MIIKSSFYSYSIPTFSNPLEFQFFTHCPKNNLNLHIKTEPITRFQRYISGSQTDTNPLTSLFKMFAVASVTGSVFMQSVRLSLLLLKTYTPVLDTLHYLIVHCSIKNHKVFQFICKFYVTYYKISIINIVFIICRVDFTCAKKFLEF